LAAIVRYINITTIYTVGYLQIFIAEHFFQVSIAMICNEKSIGLPLLSTNPQIITLCTYKQGHTQLIYSAELTTEHVFEYFGRIARLLSPLLRDQLPDLSASLRNKS